MVVYQYAKILLLIQINVKFQFQKKYLYPDYVYSKSVIGLFLFLRATNQGTHLRDLQKPAWQDIIILIILIIIKKRRRTEAWNGIITV